jgi:hypothetical protein
LDLEPTLRALRFELEKITTTIQKLEELQAQYGSSPSRRGRQSMGVRERQEVSKRMKRYWAGRRQKPKKQQSEETAPLAQVAATVKIA